MTTPEGHANPPGPDPHEGPPDPDGARDLGVEHLGAAAEASADGLDPLRERVGRLLGGYSLGECLGRGGMGAVFLATQERLDRKVAVKVLIPPTPGDQAWTERFQREARALARLSHPNIVAVHDFGQAEDVAWIVLEYVEGASLRQVLNGERLSPAEALAIVPQVCAALQYAHERGVIHRDIKPENILLDVEGNVKIADFGLAKLTDGKGGAQLTATDQAMGTLRYMAPEQLERPKSVDHRADIFALGVVFYELLTGQVPVGRVEPPSSRVAIDVRLDEIVLRALEREPEKRYQSAYEVRASIADLEKTPGKVSTSQERNDGSTTSVRARTRALMPGLARRRMALSLQGRARLRWIESTLFVAGLASLSLPWIAPTGTQPGWESPFGLLVAVLLGLGLLLRWAVPLTVAPWVTGATTLAAGVATFFVAFGHAADDRHFLQAPPQGPILAFCMGAAIGLAGLFAIATKRDAD